LRAADGDVITTEPAFEPNLIEDRELITGQNPRSDHLVGEKLVLSLQRAAAAS
jgi:putative intracellular protease/amidase